MKISGRCGDFLLDYNGKNTVEINGNHRHCVYIPGFSSWLQKRTRGGWKAISFPTTHRLVWKLSTDDFRVENSFADRNKSVYSGKNVFPSHNRETPLVKYWRTVSLALTYYFERANNLQNHQILVLRNRPPAPDKNLHEFFVTVYSKKVIQIYIHVVLS